MENDETKRILDMVESGRISAAEGARLMDSFQDASTGNSMTCPYCAESIPRESVRCPECGSDLQSSPSASGTNAGFLSLTGLGKFLVIYTLLVSGLVLLHSIFAFGRAPMTSGLLAALGLLSGIMILKDRPAGWSLGRLWAGLQIITVRIGYQIINLQIFHLGFNTYVNGQGFGINLVGIVLLILFMKAKRDNGQRRSFQ